MKPLTDTTADRPHSADRWPELYRIWCELSLGYRKPRWERIVAELAVLQSVRDSPRVPIRFFARTVSGPPVATSVRERRPLQTLLRSSLSLFFASVEWTLIRDRLGLRSSTALSSLGAERTAALWGLWSVYRFPNLSRLLITPQLEQLYATFREVPLPQFIQYVPRFVLFRLSANLQSATQIVWIKHLAKGGNLRRARHLPLSLSRRIAHWTVQAPCYLTFPEAFVYGIARSAGGTEADFKRIRHLYLSILRTPDRQEEIVRLLIHHPTRIDQNRMQRLLGYLAHRFQEENRFSLRRRTLPALLRQMEAWYDHLHNLNWQQNTQRRAHAPKTWKPLDFSGYEEQKEEMVYEIIQLSSLLELEAEGTVLNHCAADYANACARGSTSIWSLRSYPTNMHITGRLTRLLTIELSADGCIVQARGLYNALPSQFEKRLIQSWARKQGLSVEKY